MSSGDLHALRPINDDPHRFPDALWERSNAMMLQTTDAVRAAVRRLGVLMAEGGVIDEPDDRPRLVSHAEHGGNRGGPRLTSQAAASPVIAAPLGGMP